MTTANIITKIAAGLALAISLFIIPTSKAQNTLNGPSGDAGGGSVNTSPKGEEGATSPGGVDLRTGRFAYSVTDIAVGSGKEVGGLVLQRLFATPVPGGKQPFANMTHNWDITIHLRSFDRDNPNPDPRINIGPDTRAIINFGSRSQTFEKTNANGGYAQSSRTSKANLTDTNDGFVMEAADGTLVKFRPIGRECSYKFACSYASEIKLPDNTKVALFYDNTGSDANSKRLRRVDSSGGYAIVFEYENEARPNLITKSCIYNTSIEYIPNSQKCDKSALLTNLYEYYSIKEDVFLSQVKNSNNEISYYSYTDYKISEKFRERALYKMGFRQPGQTKDYMVNSIVEKFNQQYEIEKRVIRQDYVDGRSFRYNYGELLPFQGDFRGITPARQINPINIGVYNDNEGNGGFAEFGIHLIPGQKQGVPFQPVSPVEIGSLKYATTSGPQKIRDRLGREYTYNYCMRNVPPNAPEGCYLLDQVESVTGPEGIVTRYKWDGNKNLTEMRQIAKPGSGLPDIVISHIYVCTPATRKTCNKPVRSTDASGNVTDYEYAAEHGGVTRVLGPVVGGVRPETRYVYGQKYAWLKTAGGGYARGDSPIWLLLEERSCTNSAMNAAGNCGNADDLVVTRYQYQEGSTSKGSNLWLLGTAVSATNANGQSETLRTCYGYDEYGRKVSETQPKGTGSTCS